MNRQNSLVHSFGGDVGVRVGQVIIIAVVFTWACWKFLATDVGFFPQDDAYIILQFAKEFLSSGTLAYNSGEPSAGITSPLFVVFVSLVYKFFSGLYAADFCELMTSKLWKYKRQKAGY